MQLKAIKILDKIKKLYTLPRTKERFDKYLFMLHGNTKEMVLPIAGFNPMAKTIATEKVEQLIELKAEVILENELMEINTSLKTNDNRIIQVAINLVDDVEGSWSNIYATDYISKFEIEPLIKRNFCTPYFWTSELYTTKIITQRIREYIYRSLYWIYHDKPKTLQDFLEQEVYTQLNATNNISLPQNKNFKNIESFFRTHCKSEDYNIIFNFFYGSEASKSLKYHPYNIKKNEGVDYAKYIARIKNKT